MYQFVFYCSDKYHGQKQLREKIVYLAYMSRSHSIIEGIQGVNPSRSRGRNHGRKVITDLLLGLTFSYLFFLTTTSDIFMHSEFSWDMEKQWLLQMNVYACVCMCMHNNDACMTLKQRTFPPLGNHSEMTFSYSGKYQKKLLCNASLNIETKSFL